ncbi:MAG: 2,3-diaminopropionate biosynthesis protein SbnA [Thermoanaerobaculia bacterium]
MRPLGSILEAVGETPLIHLRRRFAGARARVLAKIEGLNPGGSSKDRPALRIVEEALARGELKPGSVVVESSSGNMGIGLAQACRYHGLRLICVVDPKASRTNIAILRAYGAEVDAIREPDPETGEYLQARLHRVQEILAADPAAFWPNQYGNRHNAREHYETTMEEILRVVPAPDYLFIPTSTCGTLAGCAQKVRELGLSTRVVAVDAVGSLIFDHQRCQRLLPGLGASLRPPLCPIELVDEVSLMSDLDAVRGCRRLLADEAIFAGASSGAVVSAIERALPEIAPGSEVVGILPDRGERYLDTVFSDSWTREHFGDAAFENGF